MRIAVLLATLSACTTPPEPGVFVGPVGTLSSRLGLVTNEGGGRAYLAGGPDTMERHHTWFEVVVDGNTLEGIADLDQGLEFTAEADGENWRGSLIDLTGTPSTFVLTRAKGVDGVYGTATATDSGCEIGGVVHDGALQGVYCAPDGTYAQLLPVGDIVDDSIDAQTDTDPPIAVALTPAKP